MTTMTYLDLPLAQIDIPDDRARSYDAASAEALAAIIAAQGLMHPITVRQVGDRYRLVAGLHRYQAFRINGAEIIPARLSTAETDEAARLEEVMENLGRAELSALDRCQHLFELKCIYDAQHPGASQPGRRANGKSFPISDDKAEVFGFAADTAEKVGLSKRAINLAVKIWTNLAPTVRQQLVGTAVARKQTELKALSELDPRKQQQVLDVILDPETEASNVAGAIEALAGGVSEVSTEKRFKAVREAFGKLPDAALDMVVSAEADRVIASLKRLGHI
ncbi:ParB N-terminal domain-containing protein [Salipiger manganoxidans]|uniref:ParB/RepB/Spo0J family partition protein n=1 Tax=Salipiger marinus TaxID=555512 RepID=UPI002B92DD11|nr:ParB N-terminal domain-containing protein [Salipiger manganoxidans]MEB3417583.1 ParB N-terminal domain-containing protein [Salipiger manganoxidans]